MRIAYLILAHEHPGQVARLIRAIAHPQTTCIVHVDAKRDLRDFVSEANEPSVVWMRQRLNVSWGAYSQLLATLSLLREARTTGPFDRYCLLSGACYPIKHNEMIVSTLAKPNVEYISISNALKEPGDDCWDFVHRYHFVEATSPDLPALFSVFHKFVTRVRSLLFPIRRYPGGLIPYKGSTWWGITDAFAKHVLDHVTRDDAATRFHRYSKLADEIFFHTLAKNDARFSSRIRTSAGRETHRSDCELALHFIDWSWARRPLHPKALDASDADRVLASSALFARKMHPVTSAGLLDLLDAARLKSRPNMA